MCLANDLADLFVLDFDGLCGGDSQQRWRHKYSRTRLARGKLFRPTADHRRRMLGGYASRRFHEKAWACEWSSAERSVAFDGEWSNLDDMMKETGAMCHTDDEAEKVEREQLIAEETVRMKVLCRVGAGRTYGRAFFGDSACNWRWLLQPWP